MDMDSQKLLGNVVDSLRVRTKTPGDPGRASAGVEAGVGSSSAPFLDEGEVRDATFDRGLREFFFCAVLEASVHRWKREAVLVSPRI